MKPTTLLTALLTTASAATLLHPRSLSPPAPQLRLLHTLPSSPSHPPTARLLSTTSSTSAQSESTRGGAILTLPPSSSSPSQGPRKITLLQSTFRLPHANPPTTGPTANNPVGVYAASFWLGLDSFPPPSSSSSSSTTPGCNSSLSLRAGIDIFHDGTLGGEQTPFAWYQFAPVQNTGTGFAGFSVAPGDLVKITVEGDNGKGEVAVRIENFGPGKRQGQVDGDGDGTEGMDVMSSAKEVFKVNAGGENGGGLCGRQAAWVVEDFPLAGLPDVPVALANFTRVEFGETWAQTADGVWWDLDPDGGEVEVADVRLDAQGGRLTECVVRGGRGVSCTRVVGDE